MKIRVEYLGSGNVEAMESQTFDWDDWRTVNAFWFTEPMKQYLVGHGSYAMSAGVCGGIRLVLVDEEEESTMLVKETIQRAIEARGSWADAIVHRCWDYGLETIAKAKLSTSQPDPARDVALADMAWAIAGSMRTVVDAGLLSTLTPSEADFLLPFVRAHGVSIWHSEFPGESDGYTFAFDRDMCAWTISNGVECVDLGTGSYPLAAQVALHRNWTFTNPEPIRTVCRFMEKESFYALRYQVDRGYWTEDIFGKHRENILASSDERAKDVLRTGRDAQIIVDEQALVDFIAQES